MAMVHRIAQGSHLGAIVAKAPITVHRSARPGSEAWLLSGSEAWLLSGSEAWLLLSESESEAFLHLRGPVRVKSVSQARRRHARARPLASFAIPGLATVFCAAVPREASGRVRSRCALRGRLAGPRSNSWPFLAHEV